MVTQQTSGCLTVPRGAKPPQYSYWEHFSWANFQNQIGAKLNYLVKIWSFRYFWFVIQFSCFNYQNKETVTASTCFSLSPSLPCFLSFFLSPSPSFSFSLFLHLSAVQFLSSPQNCWFFCHNSPLSFLKNPLPIEPVLFSIRQVSKVRFTELDLQGIWWGDI